MNKPIIQVQRVVRSLDPVKFGGGESLDIVLKNNYVIRIIKGRSEEKVLVFAPGVIRKDHSPEWMTAMSQEYRHVDWFPADVIENMYGRIPVKPDEEGPVVPPKPEVKTAGGPPVDGCNCAVCVAARKAKADGFLDNNDEAGLTENDWEADFTEDAESK